MGSNLKAMMRVVAVVALLTGLAACAKYPVVANDPVGQPPAASPRTGR